MSALSASTVVQHDFLEYFEAPPHAQPADVGHQVDTSVHTALADANDAGEADLTGVEGSAPEAAGESLAGVESLEKTGALRDHKNLQRKDEAPRARQDEALTDEEYEKFYQLEKRKELNRYHHKNRILNIMFRFSAIHKAWIIPIALAATLVIPEPMMHLMSPIFALLGIHIGIKASRKIQGILTKASRNLKGLVIKGYRRLVKEYPGLDIFLHKNMHPHEEVKEIAPAQEESKKIAPTHGDVKEKHGHALRDIVDKNRVTDFTTTLEVTAALLELLRNLPMLVKAFVMLIYGVVSPVAIWLMTKGLFTCEHRGHELKAQGQRQLRKSKDINSLSGIGTRFRARSSIVAGHAMILFDQGILKGLLPVFVSVEQYYVSGRTLAHAVPTISSLAADTRLPTFLAWSLASVVITSVLRSAAAPASRHGVAKMWAPVNRSICAPANRYIEQKPLLMSWKKTGEAMLKRAHNVIESQRNMDSKVKELSREVSSRGYDIVYGLCMKKKKRPAGGPIKYLL